MAKKGKKKSGVGLGRQSGRAAEDATGLLDKYDVQNMEIIIRSLERQNVMLKEHICDLESKLAMIREIVTWE